MERIGLETAVELLLRHTERISVWEEVSLWDAVGRVLAEDITADKEQPPFARSPLDGYAVRSADIIGACREQPVCLTVIDEVTAGHVSEKKVREGTAIRIMTGAPIPDGADCVVKQEDTDYGEEKVRIFQRVGVHQNYCFAGEDYKEGDVLLKKEKPLVPAAIGILASLGRESVRVFRQARAAVITTGDEVVLPGEPLLPGKIYDSNLFTLTARLRSLGVEVTDAGREEDDAAAVADRIRRASVKADLIVTTGGVSVGKKDIMQEVLRRLSCKRLFWKIEIKPGMPTLAAVYNGRLLLCLSGNPYGAAVNLELLARPVLFKMTGDEKFLIRRKRAVTRTSFPKKSPVTRYVRAFYKDGYVRQADGSNDSGVIGNLSQCNCLMEIPAGTKSVEAGESVWVTML